MDLPLDSELRTGFITAFANADGARKTAELALSNGYDAVWTGDHVAFPMPILDPLLQLAQLAAFAPDLGLGTSVYLLPLRHPVPVAKQVATLDHLTGGNLIFGVGVGGEFPGEYAACGVPVEERGARLSEAIPVLRKLWTGEAVSHEGPFYPFPETTMLPKPIQPGGPPIWGGGRSPAALRRLGRMGDGWVSYVVTPDQYREGLESIARAAEEAGRVPERFGTAHLLFTYVDDDPERALDVATEHLSQRYAMDFRRAAQRYGALGPPEAVAEKIHAFREAGLRHVILDSVGPPGDRVEQIERFAKDVRPLLGAP
ncbi:MAG: LLM class F420-dependent oxidoreductase [Deltaproteobacteria bacterium]|jgi:probable F420-dependent oxidoreductase|nr:LLM class F420-dependent oxidoreductase [Deltaproteobacteria bacterium]